jgi:subtilase family serine protease
MASVMTASAASGSQVQPLVIVDRTALTPTCSPTGLCPAMLEKAYGFDVLQSSGTTGSGQTVVIDDACGDPNIATDLGAFDAQFGLSNPTLNVIDVQGSGVCVNSGWSVETSLDVEMAHVTAPEATIDLLVAAQPGPSDVYGAWTYSLNHGLGNQISNSFGGAGCFSSDCNPKIGQGIGACKTISGVDVSQILTNAAADHVTVVAAAGDSQAWGQGTTAVEPIPGDCKGVLTVGGTSLSVGSSGNYLGETGWSDTGGGYATTKEPGYQSSVNIVDPYSSLAKPDVAAVASPDTGVWIYNHSSGGWLVVGGTSLATPLWAGFMADVNQIRATAGLAPAGFINSFLYTKVYGVNGGSSLYPADIHDVTTGNNGWPAGTGWDADTGIGTFIAPALANTLGTSPRA